jgi:hypothetical protein
VYKIQELPELPIDSFDWPRWRQGSNIWRSLGFSPRRNTIEHHKEAIIKHAIGFIQGYKLYCRPEPHEIAVMFIIEDEFCWTHLRKDEFNVVFG